jgi:hypothetical protein
MLAKELMPTPASGVTEVQAVAAYQSPEAAAIDWGEAPAQQESEALTLALSHEFLVPNPQGKTDLEVLREAVDLADDSEFQQKRSQMYQWQEDAVLKILTGLRTRDQAVEQMKDYVNDYGKVVKKAVGDVHKRFAFTLIPIGIAAAAGFFAPALAPVLAPATALGLTSSLVQFWVFDRKPKVNAGDSKAAAMFHAIHGQLGWKQASPR